MSDRKERSYNKRSVVIRSLLLFALIVGLFFLAGYIRKIIIATTPEYTQSELPFSGKGTQDDPFLISSTQDLISFRDAVNEGNSFTGFFFRQTADIDLSSVENWIPIGQYGKRSYFQGVYDGQGHTISNLVCRQTDDDANVGLFGLLQGEVINLGIESGIIDGLCVGSFASHGGDGAYLINCWNKATVTGGRAGGICDNFGPGKILFCLNFGETSGTINSAGIASYTAASIEHSYSFAEGVGIVDPYYFNGLITDSEALSPAAWNREFTDSYNKALAQYMRKNYGPEFAAESGLFRKDEINLIGLDDDGQVIFLSQTESGKLLQKLQAGRILAADGYLIVLGVIALLAIIFGLIPGRGCRKNSMAGSAAAAEETGGSKERNSRRLTDKENGKLPECAAAIAASAGHGNDAKGHFAKRFFVIVLFAAVLMSGLLVSASILELHRDDGITTIRNYYEQPKDTIDVLILGSSKAGMCIDTSTLWKEYGISSYLLWGSLTPFWNSYYDLVEALKTQKPEVVVLETRAATYPNLYMADSQQYLNCYGLRMSENKIRAIRTSAPQNRWRDLILGFPIYHARFNSLSENDFRIRSSQEKQAEKGFYGYYGEGTIEALEDPRQYTEVQPLVDKEEYYLRKIIETCENEDIPIVLISTSTPDRDVTAPYFSAVRLIAEEYQVPYLDYDYLDAVIGLETTDFYEDNAHLNMSGARKIGKHLGQYLTDHYELTDHRGDPVYSGWDEFQRKTENKYLKDITKTGDYVSELVRNGYTLVLYRDRTAPGANDFREFTVRMASLDLDLSFLLYSDEKCWKLTGDREAAALSEETDGCYTFTAAGIEHTLSTADNSLILDQKTIIPERSAGLTCLAFDSSGELADAVLLYRPGQDDTIIHY